MFYSSGHDGMAGDTGAAYSIGAAQRPAGSSGHRLGSTHGDKTGAANGARAAPVHSAALVIAPAAALS